MNEELGIVTSARRLFHRQLVSVGALSVNKAGVTSIADKGSESSKAIALSLAESLGVVERKDKLSGQSQGAKFEEATRSFIANTLPEMGALRPGSWRVECVGGRRKRDHLAQYEPYNHLDNLAAAIQRDRTLESVLGNIYVVSPDVLVLRSPESDSTINSQAFVVDEQSASRSNMRTSNYDDPRDIVHAVISCKFTMRSDRSQNARSEALNLIRNRKGRTPHIVVVTAEPSPSRIASLALGTGDIDMVYHMALPELIEAVRTLDNDEALTMLKVLLDGKRLRDISDLALDLCV